MVGRPINIQEKLSCFFHQGRLHYMILLNIPEARKQLTDANSCVFKMKWLLQNSEYYHCIAI